MYPVFLCPDEFSGFFVKMGKLLEFFHLPGWRFPGIDVRLGMGKTDIACYLKGILFISFIFCLDHFSCSLDLAGVDDIRYDQLLSFIGKASSKFEVICTSSFHGKIKSTVATKLLVKFLKIFDEGPEFVEFIFYPAFKDRFFSGIFVLWIIDDTYIDEFVFYICANKEFGQDDHRPDIDFRKG